MHFFMLLCTAGRILLGCPSAPSLWPSWWPPCLQNRSPGWSPCAKEKEKSHTEQDQVNREVVPVRRFSSQPGTAGCSERCEQVHCHGEAAMICPATTLVSSCALSEAKAAGSLCRLADWSSGPVARTHCGRYFWHRRTWSTWLWFLILTTSETRWQLWRLVSWSYSDPCLITSDDSTKQVWFSLKALDDILTHLQAPLLSDHYSAALAPFLRRLSAWEEV